MGYRPQLTAASFEMSLRQRMGDASLRQVTAGDWSSRAEAHRLAVPLGKPEDDQPILSERNSHWPNCER